MSWPGSRRAASRRCSSASGQLLDQLSLDGLRRWALLGVQGHTEDLAAQAGLVPAGEPGRARHPARGGRGHAVHRRGAASGLLSACAVGARTDLRAAQRAAQEGKQGQARVHRGRRDPHAAGLRGLSRAGSAWRCTVPPPRTRPRTWCTPPSAFPCVRCARSRLRWSSLIEDARVEHLAMREMPGLAAPVAAVPRGAAQLHRDRRVADGAPGARADRPRLRGRQSVRGQGPAACSRSKRSA